MKIPKKLKIGGHMVKVDCSKELPGRDGEWMQQKNLIKICKTLSQSQKEVTLIHEIFHAINSEWNNSPDRHALMDSLSGQLHQVFTDNKMFR